MNHRTTVIGSSLLVAFAQADLVQAVDLTLLGICAHGMTVHTQMNTQSKWLKAPVMTTDCLLEAQLFVSP